MSILSIEAKTRAGTNVETAIRAAIQLARKIGVTITINFNGCHLNLHPSDEVPEKVEEYHRWLKLPSWYPMENSKGGPHIKGWRPEGWKNPHQGLPTDEIFEAGADALLEALKKGE